MARAYRLKRQSIDAYSKAFSVGVKSIEFGYNPHLVVFRNLIGTKYRIKGKRIRRFYTMGSKEGHDPYDLKDLRKLGFTNVGYEDRRMRETIFDDFDKPAHFQQIMRLRIALAQQLPGGDDEASEIVMELEDINPQLFNALGAAVDAVTNAEHVEHIAQAALSGRRYVEQLADTLFPPRNKPYQGRDVGRDKYRNRLWAYLADNIPRGGARLQRYGKEVDRLVEELNSGVHGDISKEQVLAALAAAARLTLSMLLLNPDGARQSYEPFMRGFQRFFDEFLKDRDATAAGEKTASRK